MAQLLQFGPDNRDQTAWVRVLRLAERQWGVATWAQLRRAGIPSSTISNWRATGRLQRIHPGVYAVGHRALSVEGRLAAALLCAGPGAALSHTTAAWWWGLVTAQPRLVHVRTPRRARSRRGVKVHHTKEPQRVLLNQLPVTPVARTLLDLASVCEFDVLRRAIAEADFLRRLPLDARDEIAGRGRPGSAALRKALRRHRPEYARTLSPAEDLFLDLCTRHRIPLPEVNVEVERFQVDALWRDRRVIAEVDGQAAHGTPARVERDHRRDLTLRAAGYLVLRYSRRQLVDERQAVAADIRAALARLKPAHAGDD